MKFVRQVLRFLLELQDFEFLDLNRSEYLAIFEYILEKIEKPNFILQNKFLEDF